MLSLLALTILVTATGPAPVGTAPVFQPEGTLPAPPPPPPAPPNQDSVSRWYGGPAVGIDIASTLAVVGAAGANQPSLALLGLAAYTLGAPSNHFSEGHVGRGLASLAMRAGSLAASYTILAATFGGTCGNEEIPNKPSYCNVGIGVALVLPLAAMIVDDAVLAREPAPAGPPPAYTFSPGLTIGPNATLMSMGGTF